MKDTLLHHLLTLANRGASDDEKTFVENSFLNRHLNGNAQIKIDEILKPEGEEDKDLKSFLSESYLSTLSKKDGKTTLIIQKRDQVKYLPFIEKVISTFKPYKDHQELIKLILQLIDLYKANYEAMSDEPMVLVSAVGYIYVLLSSLPETVKHRYAFLLPKESWVLFEVTVSLLVHSPETAMFMLKIHRFLCLYIVNASMSDLNNIERLLHVIYDLESSFDNRSLLYHSTEDEASFKRLSDLVKQIEIATLAHSGEITQIIEQRDNLVKEHSLAIQLDELEAFCSTLNDYNSLKNIINLLEELPDAEEINTQIGKDACLGIIIQAGEFMNNKKLSHAFKSSYPLPWDTIQKLRDCFVHADENGHHLIIIQLHKGNLPNFSFEDLLRELISFKDEIKTIFNFYYDDLDESLCTRYSLQSVVDEDYSSNYITADEKEKFINLLDPEPSITLSKKGEEIKFENRESMNSILNGLKEIPKNLHVKLNEDSKESGARRFSNTILSKLCDIRDTMPQHLLYPSQKKIFLRLIEDNYSNEIFSHWQSLVVGNKIPTYADEEFFKKLSNEFPDKKEIFQELIDQINKVVGIKLLHSYGSSVVQQMVILLTDLPAIEEKWSRIINLEPHLAGSNIPTFPDHQELTADFGYVQKELGINGLDRFKHALKPVYYRYKSYKYPMLSLLDSVLVSDSTKTLSEDELLTLITSQVKTTCDFLERCISPVQFALGIFQKSPDTSRFFIGQAGIQAVDLLGLARKLRQIIGSQQQSHVLDIKIIKKQLRDLFIKDKTFKHAIEFQLSCSLSGLKKLGPMLNDEALKLGYKNLKILRNNLVHGSYIELALYDANYRVDLILKIFEQVCLILDDLNKLSDSLRMQVSAKKPVVRK